MYILCIFTVYLCLTHAGLRWFVWALRHHPGNWWSYCQRGSCTARILSSHHATSSRSASLSCSHAKVSEWVRSANTARCWTVRWNSAAPSCDKLHKIEDKSACLEFILIHFLRKLLIFFTSNRHSVRPDVWRGEGWSSWDWPPRWFPDEPWQKQIPRTTGSRVGPIPWCSWAWGPAAALPWLVFVLMPLWSKRSLFLPSARGKKQSWPLFQELDIACHAPSCQPPPLSSVTWSGLTSNLCGCCSSAH